MPTKRLYLLKLNAREERDLRLAEPAERWMQWVQWVSTRRERGARHSPRNARMRGTRRRPSAALLALRASRSTPRVEWQAACSLVYTTGELFIYTIWFRTSKQIQLMLISSMGLTTDDCCAPMGRRRTPSSSAVLPNDAISMRRAPNSLFFAPMGSVAQGARRALGGALNIGVCIKIHYYS